MWWQAFVMPIRLNTSRGDAQGLQAVHGHHSKLEKHYKDMQDVEFTIERSKLYMLQTRTGKRTAKSAVKIAVDMASEGLITKEQAVLRVTPENVDALLHPQFDEEAMTNAEKTGTFFAKGVNASPAQQSARSTSMPIKPRAWQGRKTGHHHGAPLHQAG